MFTRIAQRDVKLVSALCVLVASLCCAYTAGAATPASNYRIDSLRYSSGAAVGTCRGWGADADDAGHFYMGCPVMRDLDGNGTGDVQAPALYEMDSAGKVVRIGWLPSEYAFDNGYPIRDVGVSPDGKFAYVSVGPNLDNLGLHPELHYSTGQPLANGATAGSLLRLVRQADGSWAHDPSFKAGPFLIGGNFWAVRYVDVDASGRVYVTVNSYVYEISPTTGQIVSAFGGAITAYPGGPWVEGFDKPEGLAVSADGNTIWIVDQQHQIVQKWRRVGATDWTRDTSILLGTPDAVGDYCETSDHFQSPYDVGVDAAGDVYVLDTTCQRIQRFTSTGRFVQTVWSNAGGDDFNHGFGVNWQGSIVLPIEEDVLVRLDPASRPTAAGGGATPAESPKRSQAQLPLRARARIAIAGRGCSRIAPARRIGTKYVLKDRCARLTGRIVAVRGARMFRVRITTSQARAIYANAVGPVKIWVVGDARTTMRGKLRVGGTATIDGALVAERSGVAVYAMPADRVTIR